MLELGFYEGTSLASRLIRWQTWRTVSHVAARRDDTGEVIQAWHLPFWSGGGVIRRPNWFDEHNAGTAIHVWRIGQPSEEMSACEALVWQDLESQLGCKYDWSALVRMLPRCRTKDNGRWFCSELIHWATSRRGLALVEHRDPEQVSPGELMDSPLLRYLYSTDRNEHGDVRQWADQRYLHQQGDGKPCGPCGP